MTHYPNVCGKRARLRTGAEGGVRPEMDGGGDPGWKVGQAWSRRREGRWGGGVVGIGVEGGVGIGVGPGVKGGVGPEGKAKLTFISGHVIHILSFSCALQRAGSVD